ncbi:hypothetical protein [Granulicella arctica]|uniref:hypothetical protein n=1 Tax=Granulicella arctica TaxID=940613 RepID=UPI0021DFBE8F|nr:hypothetical protein [Granulicella arctica]
MTSKTAFGTVTVQRSGGTTKSSPAPVVTDPGTSSGTTNILVTATATGTMHTATIALTVQ